VAAFLGQLSLEVRPTATCNKKRLVGRTSGRDCLSGPAWLSSTTKWTSTHDIDVWVASASADGAPYLVPLSFDWDGEALLMATPYRWLV